MGCLAAEVGSDPKEAASPLPDAGWGDPAGSTVVSGSTSGSVLTGASPAARLRPSSPASGPRSLELLISPAATIPVVATREEATIRANFLPVRGAAATAALPPRQGL